MNRTVPAIYDAGVFRPLTPVDLAQATPVEVRVPIAPSSPPTSELFPDELRRQQAAVEEMLAEIEALPVGEPNDGFSGRDHDNLLYGRL